MILSEDDKSMMCFFFICIEKKKEKFIFAETYLPCRFIESKCASWWVYCSANAESKLFQSEFICCSHLPTNEVSHCNDAMLLWTLPLQWILVRNLILYLIEMLFFPFTIWLANDRVESILIYILEPNKVYSTKWNDCIRKWWINPKLSLYKTHWSCCYYG